MRVIKFRGKLLRDGEWIYGSLIAGTTDKGTDVAFIVPTLPMYRVDPNTVGQFTGLKDRNGRDIYDGDIIKEDNLVHKILWVEEASAFCRCNLEDVDIRYRISRDAMSYVEVIGNEFDNSSLVQRAHQKPTLI